VIKIKQGMEETYGIKQSAWSLKKV
jgi:hypothetical protein